LLKRMLSLRKKLPIKNPELIKPKKKRRKKKNAKMPKRNHKIQLHRPRLTRKRKPPLRLKQLLSKKPR